MRLSRIFLSIAIASLIAPTVARAENKLGGHFGLVVPLATRVAGETTTVDENFVVGFPMGISIKKNDRIAFDLEFVPAVDDGRVSLTVHPGVIVTVGQGLVAGVRAAFDVDASSWGFTPLVARTLSQHEGYSVFVELDVPIRFQDVGPAGSDETLIGVAIHFGVGF